MKKAELFKKRWEEGQKIEDEVQRTLEKLNVKWIWKKANSRTPDFGILYGQTPMFIEVTSDSSKELNFYIAEWKYEFLLNYPLVIVYKKKALDQFFTFLLMSQEELSKTEYRDKITNKVYYQIKRPTIEKKGMIDHEFLQMAKGKIVEWWIS